MGMNDSTSSHTQMGLLNIYHVFRHALGMHTHMKINTEEEIAIAVVMHWILLSAVGWFTTFFQPFPLPSY